MTEFAQPLIVMREQEALIADLQAKLVERDAENARLREALAFYAPSEIGGVIFAGGDDGGWRAAEAINKEPKP